ncbi:hypothetical protein [Deinococcus apachensis]|nr:hypothetical protein [Deinococcus apachensis]
MNHLRSARHVCASALLLLATLGPLLAAPLHVHTPVLLAGDDAKTGGGPG